MAKKSRKKKLKNNKLLINLLWIGIILILAGLIYYGGTQGWFNLNISLGGLGSELSNTYNNYFDNTDPDEINETYEEYNVMLSVIPDRICVGESTTGIIDSNIENGACRIWVSVDAKPWEIYKNILLDEEGNYRETQIMNSAGIADFQALCCDSKLRCQLSNKATLVVETCTDDSDDSSDGEEDGEGGYIGDYTCGVSEWCSSGTCPDSYTCESIESLTNKWCACLTTDGTDLIHPSWKPDGYYYNPIPL